MTRYFNHHTLYAIAVYAVLGAMVVAPFVSFLVMSLFSMGNGEIERQVSLENFSRAFQDSTFLTVFLRTIVLCVGTSVFTVLVAFPVALVLSESGNQVRMILFLLIGTPLILSYVMKLYAFRSILGTNGILNNLLVHIGFLEKPSMFFVFGIPAVFLVLMLLLIPFAVLPIYLSLSKIPLSLLEASQDLGAGHRYGFRRVVLPIARPGIASALSFTFVLAVGDFITPQAVGGANGITLGRVVYSQFGMAYNWPYGAALGILLTVIVIAVLGLAAVLGRVPGRN